MKNISKLLLVACFAMNVSYVQSSMPNQYTGSMPGQYTAGMPYIPLSPLPPMTLSNAQAYYNMLLSSYYGAQAANDMVALAQIAADLTVIKIFLPPVAYTPEQVNSLPVDQPVATTPVDLPLPVTTPPVAYTPEQVNSVPVDQPVVATPPVYTPEQMQYGRVYFINKTPNQSVTLTFSDRRSPYTMQPASSNSNMTVAPSRTNNILNINSSLKVTATDVSGTYKRSNPTWIQQKTDNVGGVSKYVTVTTDGKKLVVTVS